MAYSWTCPFCDRPVTLTDSDISQDTHFLDIKNVDGERAFVTTIYVCPNPECKKFTLRLAEGKIQRYGGGGRSAGDAIRAWNLVPPSRARALPAYIPSVIIDDYNEACLIVDLSPKASATMSRRCLQGMIRDFFGVSKKRLVDEIEAIKDKVDPTTWEAIDAVRSIGNIGAHMEMDINVILDVDPGEAEELIRLIELLVEDWYMNRYKRQEQLKAVLEIKAKKDAAKKGLTPPTATP
jgi:hypothetical protein